MNYRKKSLSISLVVFLLSDSTLFKFLFYFSVELLLVFVEVALSIKFELLLVIFVLGPCSGCGESFSLPLLYYVCELINKWNVSLLL